MIPDPLGSNLIKGVCQYNTGMYMYIICKAYTNIDRAL